MVDVSDKDGTKRFASAEAVVVLSEEAYELAMSGNAPKGDVLAVARIAGIMAAKKTSELIPLCHPLALSHVGIEFSPLPDRHAIRIVASASTIGPTGVEMEAMTAASVAALTIYDMVKAVARAAAIESVRLLEKSGGKSGAFKAEAGVAPVSKTAGAAVRARMRPAPNTLMDTVAAPARIVAARPLEREAFRAFMLKHRLKITAWARSADVPMNEVYAFLNGRLRAMTSDTEQRLARAANASVADMFGRTRP